MNRREAIKAALGLTAVLGTLHELPDKPPVGLVLQLERRMTREEKANLRAEWNAIHRGTALASVPLIILPPGVKLGVIPQPLASVSPLKEISP